MPQSNTKVKANRVTRTVVNVDWLQCVPVLTVHTHSHTHTHTHTHTKLDGVFLEHRLLGMGQSYVCDDKAMGWTDGEV